jgi:hypothetical protein
VYYITASEYLFISPLMNINDELKYLVDFENYIDIYISSKKYYEYLKTIKNYINEM